MLSTSDWQDFKARRQRSAVAAASLYSGKVCFSAIVFFVHNYPRLHIIDYIYLWFTAEAKKLKIRFLFSCLNVLHTASIHRADKQAVKYRSGQFVAIIDLADFSWSRSPPIGMIKEAVVLLRRHYPYRLGGVFIVNAGSAFNFLWNLVTPLLSKKAIGKTFVLGKHEMVGILDEKIGKEHIEVAYGGALTVQFPIEVLPIAGLADAADTTASASTTRAPSPAGSGALGLQYVEHVKTSRRRQQAVLVAMDGSAEGTVATATATAATLTTSTDANPEKDVVQHEQMMRHHLEQQRLLHVEEQAARAVQEYFDQGYWANPPPAVDPCFTLGCSVRLSYE